MPEYVGYAKPKIDKKLKPKGGKTRSPKMPAAPKKSKKK